MQTQASPVAAPASNSLVETANGKLAVARRKTASMSSRACAMPTARRQKSFLPPQPPRAWAGIEDALNWGASAPQSPVQENTDPFYSWYGAIQPVSEDCLFLNVFTPGLDGGKRPVMFWIHGGGWRVFSGTAPGFDGTSLARAQDVVVVTINHRLSGFGFLQLEGSSSRFADSGNAGLLDIVAA